MVGGTGSVRSTSVASGGAAAAWLDVAGSAGNCGITCDCTFLTASMFTLVERFFCRVCSEVFDNLSLNALSAICLKNLKNVNIHKEQKCQSLSDSQNNSNILIFHYLLKMLKIKPL